MGQILFRFSLYIEFDKPHGSLFEGRGLIVKNHQWHVGLFKGGLIEGKGLNRGFKVLFKHDILTQFSLYLKRGE